MKIRQLKNPWIIRFEGVTMTREEATAQLDAIASEAANTISLEKVDDARRLLSMLPDKALEKDRKCWIRHRPDAIEFFFSRSGFQFAVGNRITTMQTLGGGNFTVERGGNLVPFDVSSWQKAEDGHPVPGRLSLGREGVQEFLDAWVDWQFPSNG
jgi:hypothetical protein